MKLNFGRLLFLAFSCVCVFLKAEAEENKDEARFFRIRGN